MSTPTVTGSMGAATTLPADVNIVPPIFTLIPIVAQAFSFLRSAASYVASSGYAFIALLLTPLTLVLPIFTYTFAPFVYTAQMLTDMLVVTPYQVAVYILQALYPLYVFVGVACISGLVIGFGARQVVSLVGSALLGSRETKDRTGVAPSGGGPDEGHGAVLAPRQEQRRASVKGKRRAGLGR